MFKALEYFNLPPLNDSQKAELEALAKLPDDEIDFSDIPVASAEAWKGGVRGRFYKPFKQEIGVSSRNGKNSTLSKSLCILSMFS